MTTRIDPAALYTPCDPGSLGFETTDDLPEVDEVVGQERAVEAISTGIRIPHTGFNLYALGPTGSGKRGVVERLVGERAEAQAVPTDWCYVFHFADAHKPNALALPAGLGARLREDMARLVEELRRAVPEALESDEYRARLQEIEDALKERQEHAFEEMQREAATHDIAMLHTPTGFAFAPMKGGEVIKPAEYEKLSRKDKAHIEEAVTNLQASLERLIEQIPKWRRDTQEEVHKLNRDVVMAAVGQRIDDLRREYATLPEVLEYLDEVQQDVIDNADHFRRSEEQGESVFASLMAAEQERRGVFTNRYVVNLIVDHSETRGAPIVYIDNPTYSNLVGRVEHQAQLGALITDFTMIKAGALHTANGGYLIIDARKVLTQPYAWEGLKRALQSREIRIESLGQMLSAISTVSLEPECIPLNVKVVLLGERLIYYLLVELDPEFEELFKIAADFDDLMPRSAENVGQLARYVGTVSRREKLRPLDAGAVARMVEHASRVVGDGAKLSARLSKLSDVIREADFWAGEGNRRVMSASDIQSAIDAREHRHSRIRERLREETVRGTLMIATGGEQVGRVNGLSVMQLGDYEFGQASRISARVHMGKGDVVDIEREIELGGPIHSKGVLILSGFLSGHYCPDKPLSLSASLVFEQTYGGVEGDSASTAELCALLSAVAEIPVRQYYAITGSVNQHGGVQAIGGVNAKIEGFFDLCNARGLTGEQGVLIPEANVKHLMLRRDVIDAVAGNRFHIHAVRTIDEAMEILTGVPAGARGTDGAFPPDTVNACVERRLRQMAEEAREHEKSSGDDS